MFCDTKFSLIWGHYCASWFCPKITITIWAWYYYVVWVGRVCVCNKNSFTIKIMLGFNSFYWSVVDLQHCISFCYTEKWFSYIYKCIYSFSYYFPLWLITGYWIWLPVLRSRTLLLIHKYNSLHLLIPNSQFIFPHLTSP